MKDSKFTREYFLSELLKFREYLGQKDFWLDLERVSRALYGLLYAYVYTIDSLTENDKIMLEATTLEYDRRLAYQIFGWINERR